ncbi:E3 ubiquitin/ISG15 ligase TRIM25-like isoform X2 [Petromyzon marinus]|uniref:E3 ubiquitin/ISG15 ligase TRIM25-like isoform X2 n=1 Tax=Petromyzon marinus TaxID=7757 RepID=UPI003F6EA91D
MGPQLLFIVVIGCVMLGVRHAEGSEAKQCPKDSYKTEDDVCCDLCPAGTFKAGDCLTDGGIRKCIQCIEGIFYTDKPNNESACFDCTPCSEGEEIVQECRKEHNTICQCKEGYYRSNGQCVSLVALRGGLFIMVVIACISIIIIIISLWRFKATEKRALNEDLTKMALLREQDSALLSAEQARLKNYTDEERLRLLKYGCSPTLKPNTAHHSLNISSDLRTLTRTPVSKGHHVREKMFAIHYQSLCSESFSSGQHYWEVDMNNSGLCRVGAAYGNIPQSILGLTEKSWCLIKSHDTYYVQHGFVETSLSVRESPQRVGIHIDWENGMMSFYNTDSMLLLHRFSHQFSEPLYPALYIGSVDGSLTIIDLSVVDEHSDCEVLE